MKSEKLVIYHNVRCSKSRAVCTLLADKGLSAQVIHYLETPPGKEELRRLLAKLGMKPEQLVRRGEAVFKEHYAGRDLNDEEWLDALVAHPILIERPIVVFGEHAVIGRPVENVVALLDLK